MRAITKEDYHIGSHFSQNEGSKSAYYKAKKLTAEQIEKFVRAKELVGYEVEVFYRGKNRKCIIIAVSLPDSTETTYVWNSGGEQKYSSYPFDICICVEEGQLEEVWFNNIDAFNFENPTYKGVYFETHGLSYSLK